MVVMDDMVGPWKHGETHKEWFKMFLNLISIINLTRYILLGSRVLSTIIFSVAIPFIKFSFFPPRKETFPFILKGIYSFHWLPETSNAEDRISYVLLELSTTFDVVSL